jgi:hypothetical protein
MDYEIAIALDGSPIADGTDEVGQVESLSINGTALVQRAQPIRAVSPSFFDRLAKTNVLEFAITREHVDVAASLAWIAARRGATPGVGALSMTLTIGAKTVTISASSAEWGSTQGGCRGVSSRVSYTVTTGLLTVAVTGSDTLGPGDYFVPTELNSLINPLTIPAGQTGTIAAGRTCFAFDATIAATGTLVVESGGTLHLVN